MPFYLIYVVLSALIAILNIWMGLFAFRQTHMPASRLMAITLWTVVSITASFIVLTITDSPQVAYASVQFRFIGLVLIGPLFVMFAAAYTQRSHWLTPRFVFAILAFPAFLLIFIWSPLVVPHFYTEWRFIRLDGWSTEARDVGLWFNLHSAYSVAMFSAAVALIAQFAVRVDSSKRAAVVTILIGTAIGLPGAAAPFLIGPEPGLRSTPISLGLLALFIGWSFMRSAATTLMPVAYDLIFASMEDAVLLLDRNQFIISANPASSRMFRQSVASLMYKPISAFMTLPEGSVLTAAPPGMFHVTLDLAGQSAVCQVQSLPLRHGSDSPGRLVVVRDITAQQQAIDLTLERERALVLAKFIEDASHEFRTPLSVIKSSAYLIGRQVETPSIQRHVTQIDQQADRVNALINDLQLMTVLDSNRPLVFTSVDLRDILRTAVDGFARPLAAERQQTVTFVAPAVIPACRGDTAELTVAFQKIIENAIRYTPPSGSIDVTLEACPEGLRVSIRDTGIGMDPATVQAALMRFYRLDRARSTAGFGLGLPIALRVIQRHGGTLAIASQPQSGTTVTLTLPAISPS